MHDGDCIPVEDVAKVARSRHHLDFQQLLVLSKRNCIKLIDGGRQTNALSRWLRLVPAVLRLLKARRNGSGQPGRMHQVPTVTQSFHYYTFITSMERRKKPEKDVSRDGGGELSYTRSRRFETAHRFRCRSAQTHMKLLLSIHYQRKVRQEKRAPMKSRANCGTDIEEVSIGWARRFNIALK